MSAPRYEFDDFVLLPRMRLLLHGDEEVALIPRYFDLLVLLVERRHEAVSKEEIFETVWNDVVVSDGALTQAVRILRKSLGDSAREPRFIRTVSRHGYRFVHRRVVESVDGGDPFPPRRARPGGAELAEAKAMLGRAELPRTAEEEERLRAAAEVVLASADADAIEDLLRRDVARAVLREARWDLPQAATVPLLGRGGSFRAVGELLRLRVRGAMALVGPRWLGASLGGSVAGLFGGLLGGFVLLFGPGSRATASVLVALPLVGLVVGGLAAFGVGGGIAWGERLVRSYRRAAVAILGSLGGGAIGTLAHGVGALALEGLFGRDLAPVAGGLEGLVIGAAVGAGYALATPLPAGGMAAPRGGRRILAAASAGLACALAGLGLGLTGYHLGAMSLDFLARSFPGSQVHLDPLARLLGEASPGPWTRSVISSFEGLFFGFGVVFGLTRRR